MLHDPRYIHPHSTRAFMHSLAHSRACTLCYEQTRMHMQPTCKLCVHIGLPLRLGRHLRVVSPRHFELMCPVAHVRPTLVYFRPACPMMHTFAGGTRVALVLLCACVSLVTAQRYTLPWWHPWTQALARSHTTKRDHSPIFNLINPTIRAHTRESHSGDVDCPNGFLCNGEYVMPARQFGD